MKALYLLLFASGAAMANDAAVVKCRSLSDGPARLACYDAIPVGAPPSAGANPGAAIATSAVTGAQQNFGLEAKKTAEAPKVIESTIVGRFEGWGPASQITLANGQVWRVIDDSDGVLAPANNLKVRLVRNLFGNTYMEIEGTNQSPKVRRVQ